MSAWKILLTDGLDKCAEQLRQAAEVVNHQKLQQRNCGGGKGIQPDVVGAPRLFRQYMKPPETPEGVGRAGVGL
jgi:hypothetical protein